MRNTRHLWRDGIALAAAVVVVIAAFAWFRYHPDAPRAHVSRAIGSAPSHVDASMLTP